MLSRYGTYYPPKSFILQLFLTNRCNLTCKHCYDYHSKLEAPSLKTIISIIERCKQGVCAKGKKSFFVLSGGEPLLFPHLNQILKYLDESYQSGETLGCAITTNGTLITEADAKNLAKHNSLQGVQISIDGISKEIHEKIRGPNSYDRAIIGANLLRDAGIPITLSFTLNSLNAHECLDTLQFAYHHQFSNLGITRVIPSSEQQYLELPANEIIDLYRGLIKKQTQILDLDSSLKPILSAFRCDWPLIYWNDQLQPQKVYNYNGATCQAGKTTLGLLLDGTVYPCSRLPLPIGNILEEDFKSIMASSLIQRLSMRKQYIEGKCSQCKFITKAYLKGLCEGGAACLAYAAHDNPFMPDPHCVYNPEEEIIDI
ncbi:MAG: radical SAM protein [Candidatus Hodarchaeota archaeon]